ncbi:MAG TPA: SEL1-like repeat protein, partial [Gammaproteobacteria bacterium]|nr:SEL1-like repeat protein [Gammaproteobacteria bacterium]
QMAANQGNGQAQYHLAECFAAGAGVPVDPVRAYQWMIIAKASLDAKDPTSSLVAARLKSLEGQMSPAQTKQAKQAAAEWLQSHGAVKQ